MRTATFLALERVANHNLRKFEEVGNPASPFELGVDSMFVANDAHMLPEVLAYLRYLFESFFEAFFRPRHAAELPHNLAKFEVEMARALVALYVQQLLNARLYAVFRFGKFGKIGRDVLGAFLSEIVGERIRNDKVSPA